MKKTSVVFAASLIIFGCGTTLQTTAEADFNKKNHRWEGYTFAEFAKGRELYVGSCGGCHLLHRPAEFTEQQWSDILPEMIDRAKLGDAERESIFRFLITTKESYPSDIVK